MTPEAHSLFAPTPPQTAPKSLPGQLEAGMYDEKLDGFFGWRRRANERRPGVSNDCSTKRAPPGGLERDTIEPPFDPATYARESERMLPVEVASGTGLAAPRTPSFAESDEDVPTRRRHPSSAGHPSEMRVAQASRPMLEAGPDLVPFVTASREDIEWFDLDDEYRTILAAVDGTSPLGAVLLRAQVPDAITLLSELSRMGIVQFRR